MKRRLATIYCLAAFVFFARSASAEIRTWSDATGKFKVEAELVGMEGETVKLRKKDGAVVDVPLARLSAADREYLSLAAESVLKDAPPEAAIVRLELTLQTGRGRGGGAKPFVYAFAMDAQGNDPVLLSTRTGALDTIPPRVADRALSTARVLGGASGEPLGKVSGLGFDAPGRGSPRPDLAVVVLKTQRIRPVARLRLATEAPQLKAAVRLPIMPAADENRPAVAAPSKVEWVEFQVSGVSVGGSAFLIAPPGTGKLPETPGLPVLNDQNEVVGIYGGLLPNPRSGEPRGTAHAVQDIQAALELAKVKLNTDDP
jgi:hypothetical protein